MDPITIAALLKTGEAAIKRLFPDKNKQQEELTRLEEIATRGDIAELNAEVTLLTKQLEINLEYAKSDSFFMAGPRQMALWIGVFGLAWNYIIHPVLLWFLFLFTDIDISNAPPTLDMSVMAPLVFSLLGISYYRSKDKEKGVNTKRIIGFK